MRTLALSFLKVISKLCISEPLVIAYEPNTLPQLVCSMCGVSTEFSNNPHRIRMPEQLEYG